MGAGREVCTVTGVADQLFEEPRLAAIYDPLDPDRSDLELYVGLVEEFEARTVLDVGCGTGTFACLLAKRGIDVIGLDPAAASLDVARTKSGADRVTWVHGDITALGAVQVDLATMTANVAQVFLTDDEWQSTLEYARAALEPGGHLAFETRNPAEQAWRRWNRDDSYSRTDIPGIGLVETWVETTDVTEPFVTFRRTYVFETDDTVLTSSSTLRFRSRAEVADSLAAAGLVLNDVRDAPDRPGREFVFIARRPTDSGIR